MEPNAEAAAPLVSVRDLVKHYGPPVSLWHRLTGKVGRPVRALNGVSLDIARGETLGVIGESGCGKSTLGRAILRLHEPTSGRVTFDGVDVLGLDAAALKRLRPRMQIIFQDPFASLNPRHTVEEILTSPLLLHKVADARRAREMAAAMVENVGLKTAYLSRYPHQFSGGQRQRVGIARALILKSDFVLCDEPVSALDVSIQAQIIQLLGDLKRELGLTYLFISHDIAVIGYVAERVAVMYLGAIVESGPTRAVLEAPRHPYTRVLLSAVPRLHPQRRRQRIRLEGDPPSPLNPPPGCAFHTRCPHATERCAVVAPVLTADGAGRAVACHLVGDAA